MTTQADILGAARARILAAIPAMSDLTDEPHPVAPARVPAYAVEVEDVEQEVRSMGAPWPRSWIVDADVRVTAWTAANAATAASLHAFALEIAAALMAPPVALGGLVRWLEYEGAEVEIAAAETRIGRVSVGFAVQYVREAGDA